MRALQDPAGLLERVPELATIAEHSPRLCRSIERGRPHTAYRTLFWLRLFNRLPRERSLLDTLLARRRLFVEPLQRKPVLTTVNGIGATVYGKSEFNSDDLTYIKSHFLTFLFAPLYPLAEYLVVDAGSGRGWHFLGKLPLRFGLFAWQRLAAFLVIATVAAGATSVLHASRYNTVHVLNGLTRPVSAQIGKMKPLVIPAEGHRTLEVPVGRQPVRISADKRVVDSGTLEVSSGTDLLAWNVAGAAPLYRQAITYSSTEAAAPPAAEPTLWCGEHAVVISDVDFLFETPPEQISMSEGQETTVRSQVDIAPGGVATCIAALLQRHDEARASQLAQAWAEASNFEIGATRQALDLLERFAPKEAAAALAEKAVAAHTDSLLHHRAYQDVLLGLGERQHLLEQYRERAAKKPDDPDSIYLRSRVEDDRTALPILQEAAKRFPKHAFLQRALFFTQYVAGDNTAALATAAVLHDLDEAAFRESLPYVVRAQLAAGQNQKALRTLEEQFGSLPQDSDSRGNLATLYALVAQHTAGADAERLLAKLTQDAQQPSFSTLRLRLLAGLPVSEADVDKLPPGSYHDALSVELAARLQPNDALEKTAALSPFAAALLDGQTWVLLFAEASRRDANGPAATTLAKVSPIGQAAATALARYVASGEESEDFTRLPPPLRAPARFVRARQSDLARDEQQALLRRAQEEDNLGALLTAAMAGWRG